MNRGSWDISGYLFSINTVQPNLSVYSNDPFAVVTLDITTETIGEIINQAGPQLNLLLPSAFPAYGISNFIPGDVRKTWYPYNGLMQIYYSHNQNYDGVSNIDNLYLSYQMTLPS